MFIKRIEKETPSGYEPHWRIAKVINPHPRANITLPHFV
jgi:hypothetical protein